MRMKFKFWIFVLLLLTGSGIRMNAQSTLNVSGVVHDEEGETIIGASVLVKGTTQGVVTDIDGKFRLEHVRSDATLQISFVGYQTVETKAKAQMHIVMRSDSKLLEEVVVVAFGEQKRSSFTGSAGVVNSEKLAERQVTNVVDALQGQVAGVQMINTSGAPDAKPEIRIRGFSSIRAGQDPLIVLDGVPYDGDWNSINPSDVESMTVLKDAASNALYGARGANGVIMITTKRAKTGDAVITLDAKWGVNERASRTYDVISDPGQYYETHYMSLRNYYVNQGQSFYDAHVAANNAMPKNSSEGGLGYVVYSVPDGQYLIGENGRLNPNAVLGNRVYNNGQMYLLQPDDWLEEAYRSSLRQEYNLNINGGNEKSQYYASIGYLGNDGIVRGSDYERYSARMKMNFQAKKWLRVQGNVSYTHSVSNGVDTDNSTSTFSAITGMAPIYPLYVRDGSGRIMTDSNGQIYDFGDGMNAGLVRPYLSQVNMLKDDQLNTNETVANSFSANGALDITPLEGLRITVNGSATDYEYRTTYTQEPFYGYGAQTFPDGYVTKAHSRVYTLNFQQLINYTRSFGKHNLTVLFGHENYKRRTEALSGARKGMFSYFEGQELDDAASVSTNASSLSTRNQEGWFFRGQYDYAEKYFGSVSYRRDASSRFHPDNRWGNFYSFGGAWLLSKESWLSDVKWIDELKLKASFGQQGNDEIGDLRYTDTYEITNFDGKVGLTTENVGNKDITWETNTNINVGIEFDLFKSRLKGGVEYFYRKTTDMLSFVRVPMSEGYSGYFSNIGDMVNKGIEMELSGDIIRYKEFTWNLGMNLTHCKNEITRLSEQERGKVMDGHAGYVSGDYFYGEGLPIYTRYMKRYAGVSENGESQWYKNVEDEKGNIIGREVTTTYADADYYLCDSPIPDLYGGVNTRFTWKGIDLSIGLVYSIGGKVYDSGYAALMAVPVSGTTGKALHKDLLDAWSPTNTTSNIPRLQYNDVDANAQSDRFLTDGSYLTLQNINLGYTLPKKMIRSLGISSLRIYAACDNVAYWSKRKGMDPRRSFTGTASGAYYSPVRSISGGLTVQF